MSSLVRAGTACLLALCVAACNGGQPASSHTPTGAGSASPSAPPTPTVAASLGPSGSAAATPRSTPSGLASDYSEVPAGTSPGQPLGYLEYLPPGYGDATPRPLLVFLHGNGQGGSGSAEDLDNLTETGIPALISGGRWPAELPFVVLMPQHEELELSPCMEATEVAAFLDYALETYAVDRSRVYLSGVSCGAIGIWQYLALYRDEVVAAVVPVAGDGRYALAIAGCELGRVPIWAIHGADDEALPVDGSSMPIRALEQCTEPPPADARLTVLAGEEHVMWQPIYDGSAGHDIYGWLLSHRRAAP